MEPPGQQVSAGKNGDHSWGKAVAQLDDHPVHLPHVDPASVDQLLVQNLSSQLHVSLP
jgi:hypothetical protein